MTWEKDAMMIKKIDLSGYINNLEQDFRETVIRRIRNSCCIDAEHPLTLYGNKYTYVNDEGTDVVRISWLSIHCDSDGKLYVKYTEDGEVQHDKTPYEQCLCCLSTEMLIDIVQNI